MNKSELEIKWQYFWGSYEALEERYKLRNSVHIMAEEMEEVEKFFLNGLRMLQTSLDQLIMAIEKPSSDSE